jgi:hypothetical protein
LDVGGSYRNECPKLLLGLLSPALQPAKLSQEQAGLEARSRPDRRAHQAFREREIISLPGGGGRRMHEIRLD